jgi:hypothetical protein
LRENELKSIFKGDVELVDEDNEKETYAIRSDLILEAWAKYRPIEDDSSS